MDPDNPVFDKKNVLVTGGAGFIGSHLCEELLDEANVICMDNFLNSGMHNIDHLLQYPDFEFIRHDVSEPFDLEMFDELQKFKIDYQGVQEIYHLACPTSPKDFEELKIDTLRANSAAMLNTLELAREYRAKYVFGSSSVVYGSVDHDQQVFSEEDEGIVQHLSPRGCYDEGKRFGETCVETYRDFYDLDAKIARIFTAYGPRMPLRDGLLIPDFILDALEGNDLKIYGNKELHHSMCYIDDMINGLMRLMSSGPDVSLVNLGSDNMYKFSTIAKKIIEMTDSESEIEYRDELMFLTKKGKPDLTRAKEELNWLPLVQLEQGLEKTIDYTIANKEMLHSLEE